MARERDIHYKLLGSLIVSLILTMGHTTRRGSLSRKRNGQRPFATMSLRYAAHPRHMPCSEAET